MCGGPGGMPYRDVGHRILGAGWLPGLGMLCMLCYSYVCTRDGMTRRPRHHVCI